VKEGTFNPSFTYHRRDGRVKLHVTGHKSRFLLRASCPA